MKIRDKNLFPVNVGLGSKSCKIDITWCEFWCDVKEQEIKELVD